MRDFSLNLESEKIHSTKIKEYYQEVIKSYYNDNYRSAVVMLYSVTLCDLILKLKSLKDIYNDETSISILNSIDDLQRKNPNSPDWENKLIELSHRLAIKFFGISDNYSTADTRFQHLIKPYLHDLDNKQLEHLIRVIDSNSQMYDRRLAYSTNIEVKKVIQEKTPNFDFSNYANFQRSIKA